MTSPSSPPDAPPTRRVLGMVFLVAFLDLVGFSVIFPLFPAMLEHYLTLEGDGGLLGRTLAWIERTAGTDDPIAVNTLFGGLLGSLYSFLQFVAAPVWGALADRFGRRPILLVTLTGMAASYVLWVFAGSFAVLLAARALGGLMAGNVGVASAVVGDVTSGADRSKGMGILGMAIGLGFILGPALGGLGMLIPVAVDAAPTAHLALNPFSAPAAISLVLAIANLVWVARAFPETLPASAPKASRSLLPLSLLLRLRIRGLHHATLTYFLFLLAFSAMEFTLTFLAVGRFDFTAGGNALMFVFIGLLLAAVQGGVVRRLAPRGGGRRLVQAGMLLTSAGLAIVGVAGSVFVLYLGLAFLALGSGLLMPSLAALASLYAPEESQGLALGAFRSAGSLSRALGPILGGALFWKLGTGPPYVIAACFLALPWLLSLTLPAPPAPPPPAAPPR